MAALRIWKRDNSPDRRSAPAPAPRRANRFSLPFGPSSVKARLVVDAPRGSSQIPVQLWDVSDDGGCLSISGPCSVPVPGSAVLEINDPQTRQLRSMPVELRWTSTLSQATFVGLRFVTGPLPHDSFLREYMQTSWTDAVPGSGRFA